MRIQDEVKVNRALKAIDQPLLPGRPPFARPEAIRAGRASQWIAVGDDFKTLSGAKKARCIAFLVVIYSNCLLALEITPRGSEMAQGSTPVEIFCCYAREDTVWLQQLETHLSLLMRLGLISFQHDRLITPGTNWQQTIDRHLEKASVILLLVSANFLASDYCYGVEMERALEREARGEACVIPILVRPVDWTGAPFAHLQALPSDANPVAFWKDQDAAFADIVAGIRHTIEGLSPLAVSAPLQNSSNALTSLAPADSSGSPPLAQPKILPSSQITRRRVVALLTALGVGGAGIAWFTVSHRPSPTSVLGINTLTDDFSSDSVPDSTKWYLYRDPGAMVAVSGGQLFTIPAKNTKSSIAAIDSHMLYSAADQSAFIQVPQVASGTVDTSFGLLKPDGTNAIQILSHSGNLEVGTYKDGPLFIIPYNASTQKWWRIRENGGTTYADISSDGITWTNVYHHADFFDMSQVQVSLGSYEWAADPTVSVSTFAHFNRI